MSTLIPSKGQTWRRRSNGALVLIAGADDRSWSAAARVYWAQLDSNHTGRTKWDDFCNKYEPVLPVNVGEVWRCKRDGAQVRVTYVHAHDPRAAGHYIDLTIWWEHAIGPSKGGPWRVLHHADWLRMYELVTESAGGDAA